MEVSKSNPVSDLNPLQFKVKFAPADFVVGEPDAVVADAGLRSSGVVKKPWPCHFSD